MHPRTTTRRRGPALAAAAAALVLGGCAEPGGGPTDPATTSSPSPSPSGPSPSDPTATPTAAPSTGTPGGPWGAYPDRAEACAAVAEDLLVLALLPANLSADPTVERVQAVEDEVASVRATVPPEIAADLARVQLLVDTYGEELQEDPDARFDGEQLDEALVPVRDWLESTCRDPGRR
ncbi:hypothetical protein ACH9EU_09935 [Kocuria sp. M1R5S2]|uniref:hypothetical protein n=1 Tax=Kocuria rhizosphaerae TaxID=3376285 RepID=UPI00379F6EB3